MCAACSVYNSGKMLLSMKNALANKATLDSSLKSWISIKLGTRSWPVARRLTRKHNTSAPQDTLTMPALKGGCTALWSTRARRVLGSQGRKSCMIPCKTAAIFYHKKQQCPRRDRYSLAHARELINTVRSTFRVQPTKKERLCVRASPINGSNFDGPKSEL